MKDTISLEMDYDAAVFYAGLLDDYLRAHPKDKGVREDLADLRRQYELVWPSEDWEWL